MMRRIGLGIYGSGSVAAGIYQTASYRAAILGTQPTYAWLGSDLPASGPIVEWRDAVADVVATGAGTVPQVVTPAAFGGRKAASFDGLRRFNLGSAPALQELNRAVMAVVDVPVEPAGQVLVGNGSNNWYVGLNSNRRLISSHATTALAGQTTNPANNFTTQTAVLLFRWTVSGSDVNVTLQSNANTFSADFATGHAAITGVAWALGAFPQAGASAFVGNLADILIFTGPNYAANAAQAFALARQYYGI